MNVELLLKVKASILAEPKRYDQGEFCGAACCIAGHGVAIAEPGWQQPSPIGFEQRNVLLAMPKRVSKQFRICELEGFPTASPLPFCQNEILNTV